MVIGSQIMVIESTLIYQRRRKGAEIGRRWTCVGGRRSWTKARWGAEGLSDLYEAKREERKPGIASYFYVL